MFIWKGFNGFWIGSGYPIRGYLFLKEHRELWGYVLIPIVINVVLGLVLFFGILFKGLGEIDLWLASWTIPDWLNFGGVIKIILDWLLSFVFGLVLLIITGFLLVQLGVIIGAPWYGVLSEKIEVIVLKRELIGEPMTLRTIGGDILRAILFELKKLLLLIVVGIPLFILGFFPGIGVVVSSVGGMILSVVLLCLDFCDAPLERRRLSFRAKLAVLGKILPMSSGFGLISLFFISVPVVNWVTIPICLSGGTLLICDHVIRELDV